MEQPLPSSLLPYVSRPNEYERLVSFLLDQRFFLPVAITTSLPGGRGFGKTTLARALAQDERIQRAFKDGIQWVTLGKGLSHLELISRIEQLMFNLSGKRWVLEDIDSAQAQLHELLHPRRLLLIIDEVDDDELLRPFLQSGPGGACLLITHDDSRLPLGARRVSVDIMMPEEALALLAAGIAADGSVETLLAGADSAGVEDAAAADQPAGEENPAADDPEDQFADTAPAASGFEAAEDETISGALETTGLETGETDAPDQENPADRSAFDALLSGLPVSEDTTLADASFLAGFEQAAAKLIPTPPGGTAVKTAKPEYPQDVEALFESLADRLNEWPLPLALINGMLRTRLASTSAGLLDALQFAHAALDRQGLEPEWRIDDPAVRSHILVGVVAACLEQLPPQERERYLELAVFPAEENIPLATAAMLWNLDGFAALALAERLAHQGLIHFDPGRDVIRLHRAIHDSLHDLLWSGQLPALHARLVDAYHARCLEGRGWSSGPDDGYYFQHLAAHLMAAGRRVELQALLFDFGWLSAFLNCADCPGGRRGDMYALLGDFEIALSTALDQQSGQLRLVQDALRLSAKVVSFDPNQLAPQLLGRLLPFKEPEIQALVQKAVIWRGEPWLRPLAACFTPPGGDEVRTLAGHEDWVTGVAILPDGQHAVTSSLDGNLRVWDLANGQTLRVIEAHPGQELSLGGADFDALRDLSRGVIDPLVGQMRSSSRGTGQLGPGLAGLVQPGTAGTPNSLPAAFEPGGVSAVVITPDGQKAITAGWDGMVRIWNLGTGQMEREIFAHVEPVGALAITPDGKRIISGADDRLVKVWDLASGDKLLELVGHSDLVRTLAVTPDGRTLVSGSWDYTLRLWDLDTGALLHILTGHEGWVRSVTFSTDGYFAISGAWDRTVRIWDLWTGEAVRVLEGFRAPIFAMAVTPDNRLIITGGGDGSVGLWNLESGEQVRSLTGHTGGVNAIAITAGGRFAVSAADDRTIRVWDLVAVQGGLLRPGHGAPVPSLTNLPDGNTLMSASWDGKVKLWEPASGRELRVLDGHSGGVIAMAVTADGRKALTGSRDHTLKLWAIETGQEILSLSGHDRPVTCVAITADGRTAASGDDGGTLRVWDLETAACVATFLGEGAIWACALTPDGRVVSASESTGKMYFLQIER